MGAQHGFLAGQCPFRTHSDLLKHIRNTVAGVEVVVNNQCPTSLELGNQRGRLGFRADAEGKGYCKFGTDILLAGHADRTVHHRDDVLGDRHAKAGSLYAADGGVALPLKRFKDMGDKFIAHANARILDLKFIGCMTFRAAWFFCDFDADNPAGSRVLDGIVEQIEQYLVQTEPVTVDIFILYINGIHVQLELLCVDIRLNNVAQPVQNFRQRAELF